MYFFTETLWESANFRSTISHRTHSCQELLKSLSQSSPLFSLLKASDCERNAFFGKVNIFFIFPSEVFSVACHEISTHDKKINSREKGGQHHLKVNRLAKILDIATAENLLDKMVCITDNDWRYLVFIKEPDTEEILNAINKVF